MKYCRTRGTVAARNDKDDKMESKRKTTLEENIPVEALCEVLDNYWRQEVMSFGAGPTSCHIFHELVAVANWLNGNTDWKAADYASTASVMPEMGWRAAGIAAKSPPPESRLPRPEEESDATWVAEGRTRFRLKGRKPSVTVIVGWDPPMTTYFAQVWDSPDKSRHYESGNLLLWLGTSFSEVEEVDALKEAVEPFVTLPLKLTERLGTQR